MELKTNIQIYMCFFSVLLNYSTRMVEEREVPGEKKNEKLWPPLLYKLRINMWYSERYFLLILSERPHDSKHSSFLTHYEALSSSFSQHIQLSSHNLLLARFTLSRCSLALFLETPSEKKSSCRSKLLVENCWLNCIENIQHSFVKNSPQISVMHILDMIESRCYLRW